MVLMAKVREDRKVIEEAKAPAYTVEKLCAHYISEHLEKRRKNPTEPTRLLKTDVVPQSGKLSAIELGRKHVHGRMGTARWQVETRGRGRLSFPETAVLNRGAAGLWQQQHVSCMAYFPPDCICLSGRILMVFPFLAYRSFGPQRAVSW